VLFKYELKTYQFVAYKSRNIGLIANQSVILDAKIKCRPLKTYAACSLVGFSQGLSAIVQYFPLTTNQHQPSLSAQKPTSEQPDGVRYFVFV